VLQLSPALRIFVLENIPEINNSEYKTFKEASKQNSKSTEHLTPTTTKLKEWNNTTNNNQDNTTSTEVTQYHSSTNNKINEC
jgi:hypothetical protein